jgi:hypothetical protein
MSIADFELRLGDAIADPSVAAADRTVFQDLAEILRSARRADGVSLRYRNIIVLHWTKSGTTAVSATTNPETASA